MGEKEKELKMAVELWTFGTAVMFSKDSGNPSQLMKVTVELALPEKVVDFLMKSRELPAGRFVELCGASECFTEGVRAVSKKMIETNSKVAKEFLGENPMAELKRFRATFN